MARQVMLSDDVIKQLLWLKETMGFDSYSQTVRFLLSKLNIGREEIISKAFEDLKVVLLKYTQELELVEILRIVYLSLTDERVDVYAEKVQKRLEEVKTALWRLHKELRAQISQTENY